MRKFITLILCLAFIQFSYGQEGGSFERKGTVLIETGYNFFSIFSGGSGFGVISVEGESITSVGFDGGYFVSENFALKFGLNVLSGGASITSFQAGGKYYIGGVVPLELTGGLLSAGGNSAFLGNFSVGYGIKLAPNINLEPSLGLILTEESFDNLNLGINFAMFL